MTIRNAGITAEIKTASGREFFILEAYVESYTVFGKDADGSPQEYVLRYGDVLSLQRTRPAPITPETVADLDGTADEADWVTIGHVLDASEVDYIRSLRLPA